MQTQLMRSAKRGAGLCLVGLALSCRDSGITTPLPVGPRAARSFGPGAFPLVGMAWDGIWQTTILPPSTQPTKGTYTASSQHAAGIDSAFRFVGSPQWWVADTLFSITTQTVGWSS